MSKEKEATITTTVHNEGSGEFESREFTLEEFIDFHTVGLNAIEKMCEDQDEPLPEHLTPFINDFETGKVWIVQVLTSLFNTLLNQAETEAGKEALKEAAKEAEKEKDKK